MRARFPAAFDVEQRECRRRNHFTVRELPRQTDGARSSRFELVELAVDGDVRLAELSL
jgi:hypothetical protein